MPARTLRLRTARNAAGAALAVMLLLSGAVRAACPGDAGERVPTSPQQLRALADELAAMEHQCNRRAGYLAYRGAVLNALGEHAQAALLLERALLLDPRRAGAEIDYAQALDALGDHASAVALLRDVLARPDVPAFLRPRLQRRIKAIEALEQNEAALATAGEEHEKRTISGNAWQGRGTLALKLGRDSNLNSAPSHDALTLTLPGGDALLQLAERFRPRAGGAARLEGDGQWVRPLSGGTALQLYADARLRDARAGSATDYQQFQAGGAWRKLLGGSSALRAHAAPGFVTIGASASDLRYGGAELYRAVRLTASRDWQLGLSDGECRPGLGVEGESRHYPSTPELQGRFFGLSAGLRCTIGEQSLVLAARSGRDRAQAERPGGDQRQFDLRATWSRPFAGGRIAADLLWYRQADASGYSPLLENDATRWLKRTNLYLEYSYRLAPRWALLVGAEAVHQRSNLDLFDLSDRAFYLGVRWTSAR